MGIWAKITREALEASGKGDLISADDTIKLYHGTSQKAADSIRDTGELRNYPWLSSDKDEAFRYAQSVGGDGPAVVEVEVDISEIVPSSATTFTSPTKSTLVRGENGVWGNVDPALLVPLAAAGAGAGFAANNDLGADDYVAAVGHAIPELLTGALGDALKAGGYVNSLIGAEDPERVDARVDAIMSAMPDLLKPDDDTARAQGQIMEAIGGEVTSFLDQPEVRGLIDTFTPHYQKLPHALRGLLENL